MSSFYENLPVYKKALELTVYFENIVRHFGRYHKYTIGSELRNLCREILKMIAKANLKRSPHLTHATSGGGEMKKYCWVAHKYRKGWRLALNCEKEKLHYIPYWFKDKKEIDIALKQGCVFVFLKEDGLLSR